MGEDHSLLPVVYSSNEALQLRELALAVGDNGRFDAYEPFRAAVELGGNGAFRASSFTMVQQERDLLHTALKKNFHHMIFRNLQTREAGKPAQMQHILGEASFHPSLAEEVAIREKYRAIYAEIAAKSDWNAAQKKATREKYEAEEKAEIAQAQNAPDGLWQNPDGTSYDRAKIAVSHYYRIDFSQKKIFYYPEWDELKDYAQYKNPVEIKPEDTGSAAFAALLEYGTSLKGSVQDFGAIDGVSGTFFNLYDSLSHSYAAISRLEKQAAQGSPDSTTMDFSAAANGGKSPFRLISTSNRLAGSPDVACMAALAALGYFADAASVDLAGQKITFATAGSESAVDQARGFVDELAWGVNGHDDTYLKTDDADAYAGPLGQSLQAYVYFNSETHNDVWLDSATYMALVDKTGEGAIATNTDSTYTEVNGDALAWGKPDTTLPSAYFRYFPLLQNTITGELKPYTKLSELTRKREPVMLVRGDDGTFYEENPATGELEPFKIPTPLWKKPDPEKLQALREGTKEFAGYRFFDTPEHFVLGPGGLPILQVWLMDQAASPVDRPLEKGPVRVTTLTTGEKAISFDVAMMSHHQAAIFLSALGYVDPGASEMKMPLRLDPSIPPRFNAETGEWEYAFAADIPQVIFQSALTRLDQLLSQSTGDAANPDEKISIATPEGNLELDRATLTGMRELIAAYASADQARIEAVQKSIAANENQADVMQQNMKSGRREQHLFIAVIVLQFLHNTGAWGWLKGTRPAKYLLGTLPDGLRKLGMDYIRQQVPPGGYKGQRRVYDVLMQALRNKAANPSDNKAFVVLGEAGSGKSALVFQVLHDFILNYPDEARRVFPMLGSIDDMNKVLGIVGSDSRVASALWERIFTSDGVTVIDEVHRLKGLGSHSGSDVSQIVEGGKEGLANKRGFLIVISTSAEWQDFAEHDQAFASRFEPLRLEAITPTERLEMLRDRAEAYLHSNNRLYTDDALIYIRDNYMELNDKHPNRGSVDGLGMVELYIRAGESTRDLRVVDRAVVERLIGEIVEGQRRSLLDARITTLQSELTRLARESMIDLREFGVEGLVSFERLQTPRPGETLFDVNARINALIRNVSLLNPVIASGDVAAIRAAVAAFCTEFMAAQGFTAGTRTAPRPAPAAPLVAVAVEPAPGEVMDYTTADRNQLARYVLENDFRMDAMATDSLARAGRLRQGILLALTDGDFVEIIAGLGLRADVQDAYIDMYYRVTALEEFMRQPAQAARFTPELQESIIVSSFLSPYLFEHHDIPLTDPADIIRECVMRTVTDAAARTALVRDLEVRRAEAERRSRDEIARRRRPAGAP